MEPTLRTFDDLGGGLNEGGGASAIADNQFVHLDNFYPYERRIIRRNGTFRKTTIAHSALLTGMLFYRAPDGIMYPLFGTPEGFARYGGGDTGLLFTVPQLNIPEAGVPSIAFSDLPWVMVQMNGVGYAMREGSTKLLRLTNAGWGPAGFAPPAAACTIAINAAGVMTAGARTVKYTFRNSQTGEESNMSPVSNSVTLGADDSIDVTALAISPNPHVNQRRLYVNAPGTDGVWLHAGDVDDNSTTTANINKAVNALGHVGSVRNGLPPDNLRAGDIFLDSYLVATDGVDVFISEAFRPSSFYAFNKFDVFKNDGHEVRAVRAWGDRVVVGKTNKIHYFTKLGTVWNRETLSEKHGCYSHHSMQIAGGRLVFYGGDDIYASDGGEPYGIGSTRVKKLLARIPAARKEYVTAAVFAKLGWYVMCAYVDPAFLSDPTTIDAIDDLGTFPTNRGSNNVMIVWNYRTNAWCTFTFTAGEAPMLVVDGFGDDWEQALFAIFYDRHYYHFNRGTLDDATPIRARARSKAHRLGPAFGMLAAIRRLYLQISTSVAASITLRLYRDNDSVAIKERTVTLTDLDFARPREMKGFNMVTGEKGAVWQWEVDYSGAPPLEIEAAAIEAIPVAHRVVVR